MDNAEGLKLLVGHDKIREADDHGEAYENVSYASSTHVAIAFLYGQ